jgi:hypothetical protein
LECSLREAPDVTGMGRTSKPAPLKTTRDAAPQKQN